MQIQPKTAGTSLRPCAGNRASRMPISHRRFQFLAMTMCMCTRQMRNAFVIGLLFLGIYAGAAEPQPKAEPQPEGWTAFGNGTVRWSTEQAHEGSHSVSVQDSPEGVSGWSTIMAVRPDRNYQISVWVRTENIDSNTGAGAVLQWLNVRHEPIGKALGALTKSKTQDWKKIESAKTAPPEGAYYARLVVGLDQATGCAWLDDIALTATDNGTKPFNLIPNGDFTAKSGGGIAKWTGSGGKEDIMPIPVPEAGKGGGVRLNEDGVLELFVDRRGQKSDVEPKGVGSVARSVERIPLVGGQAYTLVWTQRRSWERGENREAACYFHLAFNFKSTDNQYLQAGGIRDNTVMSEKADWNDRIQRFTVPKVANCGDLEVGVGTWMAQSCRGAGQIKRILLTPDDPALANTGFELSSATPELVATRDQIRELFGDRPARMIVHYPAPQKDEGPTIGPLYYIDLHKDPLELIQLVDDAESGLVTDPMISPDGSRVVYGNKQDLYVVGVAPGGKNRTKVGHGYDPRWWVHPKTGDEYIIYVDTKWSAGADINGTTYMQKLKRGTCEPDGEAVVLIEKYAFRGGRSPNGQFMCTALPGKALCELDPHGTEKAFKRIIYSAKRMCNSSISQDPRYPNRWLWLNEQHDQITCMEGDKPAWELRSPPSYSNMQWGEWSTHPNYLSVSPAPMNDDSTYYMHDAWIYQISTRKWLQVTRKASTTHLWVGWNDEDRATYKAADVAPAAVDDKSVAKEPGKAAFSWPGAPESILIAWRKGNIKADARTATGEPLFETYWCPAPKGLALFDGQFRLRLDGGSFEAAVLSKPISTAARAVKALSIQCNIVPAQNGTEGSATVLSLGNAISVSQYGSQLSLRLGASVAGKDTDIRLCDLPKDTATHVAIVLDGRQVAVYRNGKQVTQQTLDAVKWDAWPDSPLILGSTSADNAWHGRIDALAIHRGALSAETIAASAQEVAAAVKENKPVPQYVIEATLINASTIPEPNKTVYPRSYSIHEYKVDKVQSGDFTGKTLRVAHWTEMDNQRLKAATYKVGQTVTLTLEPFDAHPELEQEEVFDSLKQDLDAAQFFDTAPLQLLQR